jgi:tetratricopeptide (TPR) repeat protein
VPYFPGPTGRSQKSYAKRSGSSGCTLVPRSALALRQLLNTSTRTAARCLRALADANLVREAWPGRYRLHDLLRLYARELVQAHEPPEQHTQAIRRELSWYLLTTDAGRKAILPYSTSVDLVPAMSLDVTSSFASASDAMEWFLSERPNILAAVRQCMETGQYDIAWKLAVVASGFLELSSYWDDWKSVQETGVQAARLLGDRTGEALNIQILGDAFWRTGDLEGARGRYEQSAAISHELGISWIEGFALRGIGLTFQDQGMTELALPMFQASLRLFREAGFRRGEGMSLAIIGKCAMTAGDAHQAISAADEAIALLQEIADDWSVAWTRLDLATALEHAGRDADAMNVLSLAAEEFARFKDRRCEARSLVPLGQLRRRHGDLPGAHSAWRRALDLYEEAGDPAAEEVWLLLAGPGEPDLA